MARCSICGEEHPLATMVIGHKQAEDVPDDAAGSFPDPSDWWFANADEMHAEHPRSFFIPRAGRRAALRPGELVRLEFRYGPHADDEGEGHIERMWVEVLEQQPDGRTRGRLRNYPARLNALDIGDLVEFGPEHITSIDYTDAELGYPQDQWPVVDKAVLDGDRAPDLVVKAPGPYVATENEWWMVCRDDTAGPTTANVNDLTDRFPGLEEPLKADDGLWELESGERETARWRRVPPDEIERTDDLKNFLGWVERTAAHLRETQR